MPRLFLYQNLQCEMVRNSVSNKEISEALGITERTLRNKMHGLTSFYWEEACTIQQCFFPQLTKDYLFAIEEEEEQTV